MISWQDAALMRSARWLFLSLAVVVLLLSGSPSALAYALRSSPAIPSLPLSHVTTKNIYPLESFSFTLETQMGLFASGNPINAIDPNGLDVIYLNDSAAVQGQGHTAVIVGSDSTGWNYFSKDGYGNGKWSKDNNVNRPFNSFKDFYMDSESSRYDRAVYVKTSIMQDLDMTIYGDKHYKQDYSWRKNNCGNLAAGVMAAGKVPIPGGKILGTPRPNSQYDSLVSKGIGTPFTMHPQSGIMRPQSGGSSGKGK